MPVFNYQDFSKNYFSLNKTPILLNTGVLKDEHGWRSNYHSHANYAELLYIAKGNGNITIGHRIYPVSAGDLIIYNRFVKHQEDFVHSETTPEIYYFAIDNLSIEGVAEGDIVPETIEPVISSQEYRSTIQQYCQLMIEECDSQRLGYEHITSYLLGSLLMIVLRLVDEGNALFSNKPDPSLGYAVKQYIDANYNINLSLKELSRHFHVSPYHLSRSFRGQVGDSPINYMIRRRMDEAKKLLVTTPLPVHKIAEKVGYGNVSYFNMLFKKFESVSPGKYRDKHVQH